MTIRFEEHEYKLEEYHDMVDAVVMDAQKAIEKCFEKLQATASKLPHIKEPIVIESMRTPTYTMQVKIIPQENRLSVQYRTIKHGADSPPDDKGWDNTFWISRQLPLAHNYEPNSVREAVQAMREYCAYLQRLTDDIHKQRAALIESQHEALEYIISEYTLLKMAEQVDEE